MQQKKEWYVFINGEFLPHTQKKIDIFDTGFLLGITVFDTAAVWNGRIFKLDKHLDRLFNSMASIRITPPMTKEEFKEVGLELVRKNGLKNALLFWYVTGGKARGTHPEFCDSKPSVIMYVVPYFWVVEPDKWEQGVKCKVTSVRSMPHEVLDARAKNTNRMNMRLATAEALSSGMDYALMLDMDGYVAESTGSNVWIVKGGKLYTPGEDVLLGMTRSTVLELAQREGIPALEAKLTTFDLYAADEAFLSSTAGGIAPIVEVDGWLIGDGKPGPVSRKIHQRYWELLDSGVQGTPAFR